MQMDCTGDLEDFMLLIRTVMKELRVWGNEVFSLPRDLHTILRCCEIKDRMNNLSTTLCDGWLPGKQTYHLFEHLTNRREPGRCNGTQNTIQGPLLRVALR